MNIGVSAWNPIPGLLDAAESEAVGPVDPDGGLGSLGGAVALAPGVGAEAGPWLGDGAGVTLAQPHMARAMTEKARRVARGR